jgi:hypothetical protein
MATSSSLLPKTVDKSKTPPTTKTVDKIVEKDKNEAETCESKAKINRKPVVNILKNYSSLVCCIKTYCEDCNIVFFMIPDFNNTKYYCYCS